MENELKKAYLSKKIEIKSRLSDFKKLKEEDKYYELIFCMLTPQSKAQKCWEAVQEIKKIKDKTSKNIKEILIKRTRFHNNKTRYVLESEKAWEEIKPKLNNKNKKEIRNWIAENVYGIGLKEAGHFLRNIGHSDNQIAILDRHILRNLKKANIISEDKIKSKKDYFEIENKFLRYALSLNIPADELDLLFWSKENGEIFK
ncbi:MAG: DNA lyase [Nanoarchaeota archaeon]